MKMRKWLAAGAAAFLVTMGSAVTQADSMTLADGAVLDMGASVSVYPGEKSFFGSQMHDWLMKPDAADAVEQALKGADILPENSKDSKDISEMAVDILRSGKVYQVRAAADDTYYQGMVLSLALSDGDMMKLALYESSITSGKNAKEEGKQDVLGETLNALQGAVKVDSHSSWESRSSDKGVAYKTGDARISLTRNGFMIPLYVKGIITRGEGKTVYTVFAADQASGNYFNPIFNQALKEAKK